MLALAFACLRVEAAGAPVSLTYDAWVADLNGAVAQSPRLSEIGQLARSSESAFEAGMRESPFAVSSNLAFGREGSENPSWSLVNQVSYKPKMGLDLTLSAELNPQLVHSPIVVTGREYDFSLLLSYDVVRGGSRGLAWSQARAAAFQFEQSKHDRDSQYLSARIDLIRSGTDLYVSRCKLGNLRSSREKISRMVEEARLKVKVRTLHYKDYLNFLNLEASFNERIARTELASQLAAEALSVYGPKLSEAAVRIEAEKELSCAVDVTALLARAKAAKLAVGGLEALARRLPGFLSAEAGLESASQSLQAARMANRVSIGPFVSSGISRIAPETKFLNRYAGGIAISWDIPGPRGTYLEESAISGVNAASDGLKRSLAENYSRVASAQAQVQSQQGILEALERSREQSEKLLKTLEISQSVGLVDSLNLTTAYIANIDAQNAMLDSWGQFEKSIYELGAYMNWNNQKQ